MARIRAAGRRQIPIVKMEKYSNRQVTFSKRRAGLMKKGSELCTLTGTELLIVVFSPGGKAYAFGHPSVNAIIDRFLNEAANEPQPAGEGLMRAYEGLNHRQRLFNLGQIESLIEQEKKRGKETEQERQRTEVKNWWEKPLDELTEEQLAVLMMKFRKCKDEAEEEAQSLQQATGFNGFGVPSLTGTGSFSGLVFQQPPLYPQMHGYSSVPVNPVGAGSSRGTPQDPGTFRFYDQGQTYDPIMGGPDVRMTFDQTMMRSSSYVNETFDQTMVGSSSYVNETFNPNLSAMTFDQLNPAALCPSTSQDWSFP